MSTSTRLAARWHATSRIGIDVELDELDHRYVPEVAQLRSGPGPVVVPAQAPAQLRNARPPRRSASIEPAVTCLSPSLQDVRDGPTADAVGLGSVPAS